MPAGKGFTDCTLPITGEFSVIWKQVARANSVVVPVYLGKNICADIQQNATRIVYPLSHIFLY
jgi:hypothetical protein